MKHLWILCSALSVAFFFLTAYVIATEGPLGFVTEHSRNGWGIQIGIDLFSAATVALCFLAAAGRRLHLRTWPYVVLVLCTGSIGLFAWAARILYLRQYSASESKAPSFRTAAA